MSLFTSDRERRLWFWVITVMVAIYATLGFAGILAQELIERNLLDASFALSFFLVIVAVAGNAFVKGWGWRKIWVAFGILTVYGLMFIRIFLLPEERTHLIEYGIVAVLVYQALTERRQNGGRVPAPAILAIIVTTLLGWVDEGIQAVLPNRVYDFRDVGFNTLAGLMAITASVVLAWVSQRGKPRQD